MNAPDPYDRRTDRRLDEAIIQSEESSERSALAVLSDPSRPKSGAPSEPDRAKPSIAWVRPSDLSTVIGATWARRGIDLQAELTRRARSAPAKVTARAGRRITRTAIARPETTMANPKREGLEL